ncbi:MAG: hypothetical protein KGJ93_01075 [Patescibacteria group bacterium]|nr:hypothetical protein [Patescibacteria group bacterium]
MAKIYKIAISLTLAAAALSPGLTVAAARQTASASVPSLPPLQPTPAGIGANLNRNINFQSDAQPVLVPLPQSAAESSTAPESTASPVPTAPRSAPYLKTVLWVALAALLIGLLWLLMGKNDKS